MSEEFSEEFVVEEEAEGGGRSFLIAAGSLITLFILLMACVLGAVFVRQTANTERGEQIAAIETSNARTLAENLLVTQTVAAQLTIQAQPTNTPRPPATATTPPSPTSPPTRTPTSEPEPTDTPESIATATQATVGGAGSLTATVPAGGPGAASGQANGTLPETGASPLTFIAVALALVMVVVVSRRLRTG